MTDTQDVFGAHQEALRKVKALQLENSRLIACLRNARNILAADGYLYAKDIDKLLAEFGITPPKRLG